MAAQQQQTAPVNLQALYGSQNQVPEAEEQSEERVEAEEEESGEPGTLADASETDVDLEAEEETKADGEKDESRNTDADIAKLSREELLAKYKRADIRARNMQSQKDKAVAEAVKRQEEQNQAAMQKVMEEISSIRKDLAESDEGDKGVTFEGDDTDVLTKGEVRKLTASVAEKKKHEDALKKIEEATIKNVRNTYLQDIGRDEFGKEIIAYYQDHLKDDAAMTERTAAGQALAAAKHMMEAKVKAAKADGYKQGIKDAKAGKNNLPDLEGQRGNGGTVNARRKAAVERLDNVSQWFVSRGAKLKTR